MLVFGIGELMLGATPLPLASKALQAGLAKLHVQVPDVPALVGFEAAFQGVIVGPTGPSPAIELSNGLVATIAK